ncbi:hypothetical protein JB92DRAFT_2904481 [Gautieria morchelliformis]|nr:hypothetical protein JB92DRAFT_2904481 [Gautieria morchelliformis]
MASVADFGTLLEFDKDDGLAGCAFLVAWGGMAAQSARLLGLIKLNLDLRKLGVPRWETFVFWGWLFIALVVMFASNAISIGTLRRLPATNWALCYRKHYLPTAVVSSAVNILLEVYSFFRIYYLIVPPFLSARHKFDALLDVRVSRALSLLILDLVTAVPSAHFFNILADFVPGSLAALIVLAAFNQKSPNVSIASTASIPGTRPESLHSRSTIEIKKMPSTRSLADPRQRISHPFAASALQDLSPETEDWPESASPSDLEKQYVSFPELVLTPQAKRQTWRTSDQSGVSESDSDVARSVKGAVVGFAFKDVAGQPTRRQRERSFLPTMPSMAEGPVPVRVELPRTTPLRVPRPIVPNPAQHLEAIERASRRPRPLPVIPAAAPPVLEIAVTSASPVAPQEPQSLSNSSKPSISISVPGSNVSTVGSNESTKSSLHLTPSTPARSHPSPHRVSGSSESDWRTDTRPNSYGSHPSSDEAPSIQLQRHSGTSSRLPPADDDLSIVYEASHEDSDSVPPSRPHRPTFGEHMFVEGGIGRPISTPVGVPEDVQEGGQSNGSPSSHGSKP